MAVALTSTALLRWSIGRLLSVSGEDMLTIDRKYREPWTGKLPTRFVVLSNELPRFGDASGAIANRFIVLAMHQNFLGRENTRLTDELLTELAGILRWTLDGLDNITAGSFTTPSSSLDAIAALLDLVSPVSAFTRDCCQVGPYEVAVSELFAAWKSWCEDNGHRAGSAHSFGRDLRAVIPALRVVQHRAGDARLRHYAGLALTSTHNGDSRVPLSAQVGDEFKLGRLPGRCESCGPDARPSRPLSGERGVVSTRQKPRSRCLARRELHPPLYPDCPEQWHDLYDHARVIGGTRAGVAAWLGVWP